MNSIDERLARLKHATRMAITRQDPLPTFWGPVPLGVTPTLVQPLPPAPLAARVRRVPARLIALPHAPQATLPPGWTAPAQEPDWTEPLADPTPSPAAPQRTAPAPRFAPSPPDPTPVWTEEATPYAPAELQADPFGDRAALLAAGLSETPPASFAPVPTGPVQEQTPPVMEARPLRAASFREALALNTEPDFTPARDSAAVTPRTAPQQEAPRAADLTPPQADPQVAALPNPGVPHTAHVDSPADRPARPPGKGAERPEPTHTPREDVTARPSEADLEVAPPSRPSVAREARADTPADRPASPVQLEAARPATTPAPTEEVAARPQVNEAPMSATPAPEVRPVVQDLPTADPQASAPLPDLHPDPAKAQTDREQQDRERRELEVLLRGGNNDITVRLPRRPRPVPLRAPAPAAEPEEVKAAPPIPADVSQNILARLNRFAELEAAGETEASVIPFRQLEDWQDHHPERNVGAPDLPVAPAPRAEAAPTHGTGAGPRVKARSRGQGREPQATPRTTSTEQDEDPERGLTAAPSGQTQQEQEQPDSDQVQSALASPAQPSTAQQTALPLPDGTAPATSPTPATESAPGLSPAPSRLPGQVTPLAQPVSSVNTNPAKSPGTDGPAVAAPTAPVSETDLPADPWLNAVTAAIPAAPGPTSQHDQPQGSQEDQRVVTTDLTNLTSLPESYKRAEDRGVKAAVTPQLSPDRTPRKAARIVTAPTEPDGSPLAALPHELAAPLTRDTNSTEQPSRLMGQVPALHPLPQDVGTERAVPVHSPVPPRLPDPTGFLTDPSARQAAPVSTSWEEPSPLLNSPSPAGIDVQAGAVPAQSPVPPRLPDPPGFLTDPSARQATPVSTSQQEPSLLLDSPTPAGIDVQPEINSLELTSQFSPTPSQSALTWERDATAPAPQAPSIARPVQSAAPIRVVRNDQPSLTVPSPMEQAATLPALTQAPGSTDRTGQPIRARVLQTGRTSSAGLDVNVTMPEAQGQTVRPIVDGRDLEERTTQVPPEQVTARPAQSDQVAAQEQIEPPIGTARPGFIPTVRRAAFTDHGDSLKSTQQTSRAWSETHPAEPSTPAVWPVPPSPLPHRPALASSDMPAEDAAVFVQAPAPWPVARPTSALLRPSLTPVTTESWLPLHAPPMSPLLTPPVGTQVGRHTAMPVPLPAVQPVQGLPIVPVSVQRTAGSAPAAPWSHQPDPPVASGPDLSQVAPTAYLPAPPTTPPEGILPPLATASRPEPIQVPAAVPPDMAQETAMNAFWPTNPATTGPAESVAPFADSPGRTAPDRELAAPAVYPLPRQNPEVTATPRTLPQLPQRADRPPVGPRTAPGTPTPVMPLPRPGVQRSPAAVPAVPLSTPPGVDGVLSALAHAAHRDGHGTPLAPGELAALRDVLGTSVADVRVIRRPEVAPALRAARADGLTLGDTVFLPHDLPLDRPAGLALAAHEFTHARRARDPLFVPSALTHAAPQAADEEAVALATEHAAFEHTPDPAPPRRAPGLPAPWEPLPTWSGEPSLSSGPRPGAARLPAAPAPRPSSPPPGPGAVPWHAAAADRPAPAPPAKAASRPPEDQAVGRRAPQTAAVDLDQMARDVYARLREQLSQEMRRLN